MKNYEVRKYQEKDNEKWNAFVAEAKNATFLFHRDFMEYHKDRFEDYSLIILDGEKWVAVLPANKVDNEVFSHQGLTYGSLVYTDKLKLVSIIDVFKEVLKFLNFHKIEKLNLKMIPSIYHKKPAEELEYILFLVEAQLIRRDAMSVINLSKKHFISSGRSEGVKKGKLSNLEIIEVKDCSEFWNEILIPNLELRHQAKPVHSLEEINRLKSIFTNNIRQFNVYEKDVIIAGTTIFESENVVHSQYIAGKKSKNGLGGLDLLHHYLLTEVFKNKQFFDFGISNEEYGKKLNSGLSFWKESFGASTIVHNFYSVETLNFHKLDKILV